MFLKFEEMKRNKTKGWTLSEIGIVLVIITLLAAAGILVWNIYLEKTRRTIARTDLDQLAKACMQYEMDSMNGSPPANLGALVAGLPANQTVDNMARNAYIIKANWTTDSTTIRDPWGIAYVYDPVGRTITCTSAGGSIEPKPF